MASREIDGDVFTQIFERLARLEERVDALGHRVGDLSAEVRALRTRIDALLVATIGGLLGVIATLAVKL
jgi:hypothetical protein